MCSNYEFPSKSRLSLLDIHEEQLELDTVASKASFRHAWKNNQFALVPVDTFYEPKYIDGKSYWYSVSREDGDPFTVAAIYDDAIIEGEKVRSFSMLTINANQHPFMKQFHNPNDEKRSIIVIPEESRQDWLHCDHEEASEFFFEMRDEFIAKPRDPRLSEN
ncbi:SOS response-associated peptidase family protein [Acinetobacter variabilis]|uniref:SOS response-associated peptidase family protein n=1 Tax=Acinetobacter variabilis TaxID=70346 RepID=UPI0028AC134B|nr:SOS response-associated peptidase family protein [Acinetobacter variabilis]